MRARRPLPHSPSLRAKRSNPESLCGSSLDCFVARAPRNDGACGEHRALTPSRARPSAAGRSRRG
ncbi:hypothetical protein FXB38_01515 [Bradyrhizobium cytisi]|uniref:Uncharacterized protein n=1 Tax=Bradyrhizobium cytisi TaxID=515489 RepID=A0A5S4X2T8_9BRAD|nr:hypothetical protein FXB38_01515 [Bradyrhizobium cytisi]